MAPPLCFTTEHAKTSTGRWSICWAVGLSSLILMIILHAIGKYVILEMPLATSQMISSIGLMLFLVPVSALFWRSYLHRDRAFEIMLDDKEGAKLLAAGTNQLDIYIVLRMDYRDQPSESLAEECKCLAAQLTLLKQQQIKFLEHVRTENGWPPVDYREKRFFSDYPNQYEIATAI